jgi:hypothetical protein
MRTEADILEHNVRLFVMSASQSKGRQPFIDDLDDNEEVVDHYDKRDAKRRKEEDEAGQEWSTFSQSSVIRTQTTESSYVDDEDVESDDEVLDDYDTELSED